MRLFYASLAVCALFASPAIAQLDATPQTRLDDDLRCHLGVYALSNGRSITINGIDGQPRGLRYTLADGRYASLNENSDGVFSGKGLSIDFAACSSEKAIATTGSKVEKAVRIRLIEKETSFISDGAKLRGKLVLPPSGKAKSAAVWIEGSNNNASTDDSVWQYELARRGIAIFVYDKRGTGTSEGSQSADFHVRARDTVAAVQELRRLAPHIRKIGVIGASQGGWVGPLTATKAELDFVITAFGMAEGPIAQDRELVQMQIRSAGFDNAVAAEARQLTDITERIVRSGLEGDDADKAFAALETFKTQHAGAAWIKTIQPRSYTGLFLLFDTNQIKSIGPAAAQGLTFDYEPKRVIETIKARQLWLLGGSDTQAPNAGTQSILKDIQQQRSDLSVVIFPKADHGLIEPVNGTDTPEWRYSPKLFDIAAQWIKAKKLPAPGNFIVMRD